MRNIRNEQTNSFVEYTKIPTNAGIVSFDAAWVSNVVGNRKSSSNFNFSW
jgi:hypothetical protein